jgi:hypothetical protein
LDCVARTEWKGHVTMPKGGRLRSRLAGTMAAFSHHSRFKSARFPTVCKPLIAAAANAIFDATGVRIRRAPFRDARVLAALKAARV